MTGRKLMLAGLASSAVAALCCFTPILVITFAGLGLAAWTGWIDVVLLPVLGAGLLLAAWGWHVSRREAACAAETSGEAGSHSREV